jgi:fumarylacetoacetase
VNDTHDTALRSWVETPPDTDFPIQNLPFGAFRIRGGAGEVHIGVAIGDRILDVPGCLNAGLFDGPAREAAEACSGATLNPLMSLGAKHWSLLRQRLSEILRVGAREKEAVSRHLIVMSDAEMVLPIAIGDYTDFYASIHHATNVGSMLRPDNPLLPNYKYVPIGYHGRASSIVVSGTPVHRPCGQVKAADAVSPTFGPSTLLDYELEVGFFVGPGNALGEAIPIGQSGEHLFGICLLNDWSARDIQAWEYQPLGPFLAKNFASTISPWIVTMEALQPYRIPAFVRPQGDPPPLPYLHSQEDQQGGGLEIHLEVYLTSGKMRKAHMPPLRLSRGNFAGMYWTPGQLLTHHASNGCNLRPGDLLGSGTVSGPSKDARGCLLEMTWRGKESLQLPTGETRRFLEDDDEVMMRGFCESPGRARIGLGECTGRILPA